MFDPPRATMNVFPPFWKDAYKLKEAVGDSRDEDYFHDISIVEFFSKSDFGGLLGVGSGFCTADTASEDDGVVNEWIALSGQEIGFGKLCE